MSTEPKKASGEYEMEWSRQPVCVVLNDGSFYVGWITDINPKTLTLSGRRGQGKIKADSLHRSGGLKISAFLPEAPAFAPFEGDDFGFPAFGFTPGGAGLPAAGGTGWGGVMGFMKQVWPGIQIGMGIVRAVMPLMGGLKL